MAHPCISCGSECYCSGDIDDIIVSNTPMSCGGCEWCLDEEDYDDDEYGPEHEFCPNCGREYDDIDYEYQICHRCNHQADQ